MNLPGRAGLLVLVLALTACASAPVHYYTLVPPSIDSVVKGPPASFAIDVLSVGIPEALDQQPMVVRQDNSNVAVLDDNRWAAPLGDEVRSALAAELVYRLDTQNVAGLSRPADKPVLTVKVQIRRLDAWSEHGVQLVADWSLAFAGNANTLPLTCQSQLQEVTSGGQPELVSAQQHVIKRLADQIARNAGGWIISQKQGCLLAN